MIGEQIIKLYYFINLKFYIWDFVLYEIADIMMFNVHTIFFFNNPIVLIQYFGFIVLSLQTLPNIPPPLELNEHIFDVFFSPCLWINLMSAIYWMCYLFHSVCGKRKPCMVRAQIDLNHFIICWFYHHHLVIKWPFEIQNFSHHKKTH